MIAAIYKMDVPTPKDIMIFCALIVRIRQYHSSLAKKLVLYLIVETILFPKTI